MSTDKQQVSTFLQVILIPVITVFLLPSIFNTLCLGNITDYQTCVSSSTIQKWFNQSQACCTCPHAALVMREAF